LHFLTAKTLNTPRSYEYKELQYSWRSPRLGGKTQDYLLETALATAIHLPEWIFKRITLANREQPYFYLRCHRVHGRYFFNGLRGITGTKG
jgi:hypothetical protein